ncbi:unnamed protein product [Auanema sp. JU1783]|nr:unnamed protein product [Auanema sp. JU1783]
MGVAWVFEHTGSAREIERLLEGGGAEPIGTYSVDFLPYSPTGAVGVGIQTNYVLHHSNFPQTSFSIAPSDSLKSSPRATCDRGFDLILTKMSAGLQPDHAGKFTLTGYQYRLCDFVIRVGTASQVTAVKGAIVEVEYEPSQVATQAINMLSEFMTNYFPLYADEAKKPDVLNRKSPEPYTALETMWQYLNIFRQMRSRSS